MQYQKKEMKNYNIYYIKTKKFKTISISLNFGTTNSNEDEAYRGILKKVLPYATKQYQNLDELCRARMDIYNPTVKIGTQVSGMQRLIYLDTTFINEKYTEKGMNKKSIEFALSYIFEPYIKDGKFDKKIFDLAKSEYIENLKKIKDNHDMYCEGRLWEEIGVYPYKEFSLKELIEYAKTITEKDLYNYYINILKENSLDIFIAGDIDEEEITKIIDNYIKGDFKPRGKRDNISRKANKLKIIKEKTEGQQSKLGIGLRYEDLTEFERKYVSLAYNNILGGGWNSKLNKTVREENSLCYYIYTNRKIPFGISLIYSGIDAANYDKAIELIKKQIESMKNDVTEEELQRVKDIYNNALIEIEDKQLDILSTIMAMEFTDTDTIKERKEKMNKVTIDDIKALAQKVKIEVIYLLEGDEANGKENI